ncbi:hypothetical protein [uncultured Parabacteroides sp.]|uniref:hypothetical protein n=1 Tax=uncultured Parabacteroides sp. TaxID=512312 RepID=UPI00260E1031|nr:hypothetical protein [uncultured Parabacteroides sp.]
MEEKKKVVLLEEEIMDESEESSNLDLDELLEIEGGIDVDEDAGDCGLGCFLAGVY